MVYSVEYSLSMLIMPTPAMPNGLDFIQDRNPRVVAPKYAYTCHMHRMSLWTMALTPAVCLYKYFCHASVDGGLNPIEQYTYICYAQSHIG